MNLIPQAVRRNATNLLNPLVLLLIRMHVRPNAITTVGTLVVIASGVAFALGRAHWGGFLLLFSGIFDMLDGRVARDGAAGTTFGAFYDSTLDRVGESALYTGIAVFFLNGGVAPNLMATGVIVACVALAGSLMVSYTRARAEGLGLECNVGVAQRAERLLLLGVPTLALGSGPHGTLLFWITAVLAAATMITVAQRVIHVARLTGTELGRAPRPRDTLPGHAPALQSRKGT
ncbi:MAG TPA: CDP-alcohol phosphatidyltransferase family protein [Gemmatimonadales bacterium]|jgi:CDP-diacylglycerol--glycerol-3-phosphate 3-phosphatidyltransferase|nr:CDP-alcohol phosphatidyltransferase family protein [Gemmatimonadales bacterium]